MASRLSEPKKLTVRIQSRDGTKRIEINSNDTVQNLLSKVKTEFGLAPNSWTLFRDRNRRDPIKTNVSRLSTANIKHGELLFLDYGGSAGTNSAGPSNKEMEGVENMNIGGSSTTGSTNIVEDEVDQFLDKQDGLIKRERDPKMCNHSATAKCAFCLPTDPFDESYLSQRDIKHMSFHAFIRKLTGSSHGRSTAMKYPLENIICHIKPGCTTHPSWPDGICTKCQPNAVTLNRQRYRHVDNIVFENQFLVNRFLDFWRKSGHQRIGILLGRYEPHLDVPLGIKCVVTAIYEPPQVSTDKSVRLQCPSLLTSIGKSGSAKSAEEKEFGQVEQLAQELGQRVVGWIFTDLTADPKERGLVMHTRHADTHFLSAEECISAAYFQCKYSNPCKYAAEGYYGSKFVTVVVSGGADKQVHFSGYQVSNQCAALVRDNCLVPTKDAPELAWVRESTPEQYVPDVTFMEKDNYGNDVSRIARPLPVEYLIIDVPCGVPLEPQFTFSADGKTQPFTVENRMVVSEIQDFDAVCNYASQFTRNQFLEMISDYHFLLYLITNGTFTFSIDDLKPVFEAITRKDRARAFDWAHSNTHWASLVQLMAAHATGEIAPASTGYIAPSVSTQSGQGSDEKSAQGGFPCQHCTYLNVSQRGDCVLCGLPVTS